jgi:MiaB/RimO family radical SAM methylthiotransferase
MQEFFRVNGWRVAGDYREADLILLTACGLTQYSEDKAIRLISRLKARKKPSAELIVCGCLPKINKERLQEVYDGITFGGDEVERLNEIIEAKIRAQEVHANFLLPQMKNTLLDNWRALNLRNREILAAIKRQLMVGHLRRLSQAIGVDNPHTFHIKVSTGCLDACSYCGIRISRGRVKSKPIDGVVREFEEGLSKGYSDFALLGTDLGAYGRDQGTNLTALLRELLKKKGNYKIKIRNVNPRFLVEMLYELREVFPSGKISFLSCSVESGNNRILELMNRGYRIEEFKKAIRTLNSEFPEILIGTQVMVGFPSETEDEFNDTVRLLDEVTFDFVEVYQFQPRPHTKAARMEGQIPPEVARKRGQKLFIKFLFNEKERKKRSAELNA